jgi:DNA repair exonuclease SbcCD nuclease subunit
MIKKVIHLADIHIKNYQRMGEFKEATSLLVNDIRSSINGLKREEVRILVAGDLVHQKNTVSNELFAFVAYFLRELEKIADVLVISGNHDLIINNNSRVDTLTALFETANFQHCRFLDKELDYKSGLIKDENVTWALYSIWEDYMTPELFNAENGTKIIGLFHGPLISSALSNGVKMENGIDMSIFEGCHCVMAGDIHKRQILNYKGIEIVYPGSMLQQNYGESIGEHGFAIWDIDTLKCSFNDLETEYGMYKFQITSLEDIDLNKEVLINK